MTNDTLLRECREFMRRYSSVEPQTVDPLLKRIDALRTSAQDERGRVIDNDEWRRILYICDRNGHELNETGNEEEAAQWYDMEKLIRAALPHPAPDRTLSKPSPATTVSVPEGYVMVSDEVMDRIKSWSEAYPLDIFPEPDFKKARKLLDAGDMTLDSVSASNMRHVITKVWDMLQSAKQRGEETR